MRANGLNLLNRFALSDDNGVYTSRQVEWLAEVE